MLPLKTNKCYTFCHDPELSLLIFFKICIATHGVNVEIILAESLN